MSLQSILKEHLANVNTQVMRLQKTITDILERRATFCLVASDDMIADKSDTTPSLSMTMTPVAIAEDNGSVDYQFGKPLIQQLDDKAHQAFHRLKTAVTKIIRMAESGEVPNENYAAMILKLRQRMMHLD
ncbi:hypothetical protein DFQ28_001185 [Apophysomyces sp. BC1034]|nr:hypothetical protein DFQ30_000472 [Apophysomyces sp. BC1015]KAG0168153.1 hypothetical protein DFQ29_010265 [Apophysomyces sp. BC1021]KAG0183711.1 hypothetical protein DFQ28_001185 [Apophysomyces sp. BC1034]